MHWSERLSSNKAIMSSNSKCRDTSTEIGNFCCILASHWFACLNKFSGRLLTHFKIMYFLKQEGFCLLLLLICLRLFLHFAFFSPSFHPFSPSCLLLLSPFPNCCYSLSTRYDMVNDITLQTNIWRSSFLASVTYRSVGADILNACNRCDSIIRCQPLVWVK